MTWDLIKDLIPWVLPPVLGAVIGYVTNDIAIRMLFRPLKPVRILGIRMPFTPGIFPKERYTLSKSIGLMVSRELITEEAVRRQLRAEKTRIQLSSSVSSITEEILALPLSRLSGGIGSLVTGSIGEVVQKALHRFLGSRTAMHAIRDLIGRGAASVSAMKVEDLLGRLGFRSLLTDIVLPLLAQERSRKSIADFLGREAAGRAGEIITDDLIEGIVELLEPFAGPAVDRLVEWLNTPSMQAELAVRGRKLLSGILEKLNLFQRFILSAGQFERRLEEKLPEIVDDTISVLETAARDPANQRRLFEVLSNALRDWRLKYMVGGTGVLRERMGTEAAKIVSGLLARLGDPGERLKFAMGLENRLRGNPNRTVAELIGSIPGIDRKEAVDRLSNAVIGYVTRSETSVMLSDRLIGYAARFLEDNADVPLGTLLDMDGDRKAKLDGFIFGRLMDLVDAKLPDILCGIDVQELVVNKIDALNVRDVEKLLLGVIASHLRWIDVFGAILGFIIGTIQIVLRAVGVY